MKKIQLHSSYQPAGDQIKAIDQLIKGLEENKQHQVLLGVTGSGKTFTIANVIAHVNRPTIVLSHNKTLASQLYSELKGFFPENRVEYFVSNFDYYRPEAYKPSSDTYVDKDSKTNSELEAMRMSAMNALSMRSDTIVVCSVAAIYGALNPQEYRATFYNIEKGMNISIKNFANNLIKRNYERNNVEVNQGKFSVKGDVIEISPGWNQDYHIRVDFFGEEIENIYKIDPLTKKIIKSYNNFVIYPASAYTTEDNTMKRAVASIEIELSEQLKFFESEQKLLEKQRLQERTNNDIDSMLEFGFCNGIENYARHIDGRKPGERPYTLLDYLPKNGLIIIDESHITVSQIDAMNKGDYSRKKNLVDYGFRLPSAIDNRPLKLEEFEKFNFPQIFVSATPSKYEIDKTEGEVVTQIIRPTGLLDPVIEIMDSDSYIDKIYKLLQEQKAKNERTIILATTKESSENIARFLQSKNQKVAYIHSEHKTLERNTILRKLRKGVYEAIVGVNLLREGIDLPEVSLICIIDADQEGFLRSKTSLIQIVGRAARNDHGRVIFFSKNKRITKSMQETIADNEYKREIQNLHNIKHNITPKTIIKPISVDKEIDDIFSEIKKTKNKKNQQKQTEKLIETMRVQMKQAAKDEDYERAAELRDLIFELQNSIQ